ncbi:hypothetical protein HYX02_08055 [Candidatus Woesearchaeota archaeon]|nr:hypothetical protein [Candidatus Woesearchaeota archaeon]
MLPEDSAGFYAGATRANLTDKEGKPDPNKIAEAIKFVKAAGLDYLVGSGGDDHGLQMEILRGALEAAGINCKVLVVNKTMDGDKGGVDGKVERIGSTAYTGPFADTTNGFHSAIQTGAQMLHYHHTGSWTNEVVTVVTHFGRDADWVGHALSWYGHCDRIFPGEPVKGTTGHSIEKIVALTLASMAENKALYGRKFAVIDFPEGTTIEGINHISPDLVDPHRHKKLHPETLAVAVKEMLAMHSIPSQTVVMTYELRNFPPSRTDLELAYRTGRDVAKAIEDGATGMEVVIQFRNGGIVTSLMPIELASKKRLVSYYPRQLYDPQTFKPLPEVGRYFRPLFGDRVDRGQLLPRKPTIVNVYDAQPK